MGVGSQSPPSRPASAPGPSAAASGGPPVKDTIRVLTVATSRALPGHHASPCPRAREREICIQMSLERRASLTETWPRKPWPCSGH